MVANKGVHVIANLGQIAADAWETALRESPDPFETTVFDEMFGFPRRTYRELLDRPLHNCYKELIPRIVIVRGNLRRLGKPPRIPRLPA